MDGVQSVSLRAFFVFRIFAPSSQEAQPAYFDFVVPSQAGWFASQLNSPTLSVDAVRLEGLRLRQPFSVLRRVFLRRPEAAADDLVDAPAAGRYLPSFAWLRSGRRFPRR